MRNHWVITDPLGEGPIDSRVRWAQEFYAYDPPAGEVESGPDAPISVVADREYYGELHVGLTDELDLPASFDDQLDRYCALADEERTRYLRAAQWLYAADEVQWAHRGSWFLAMSAAVETLAHRPSPSDPCPVCGHDRSERPTRDFKDFLESYGGARGSRRAIDRLYGVRSSIAHGLDTLLADGPLATTFKPAALDERGEFNRLSGLVRDSLVNWLARRASAH
jgi:hypothetical protein